MAKANKIISDAVTDFQQAIAEPGQLAEAARTHVSTLTDRADSLTQQANKLTVEIAELSKQATSDQATIADIAAAQSEAQAIQTAAAHLSTVALPAATAALEEAQKAFDKTKRHAFLVLHARSEIEIALAVQSAVVSIRQQFTTACDSAGVGADDPEPGGEYLKRTAGDLAGLTAEVKGLTLTDVEREKIAADKKRSQVEADKKWQETQKAREHLIPTSDVLSVCEIGKHREQGKPCCY